MSIFHNNSLIGSSGSGGGGGAYAIERSLRFNSSDSGYLSRALTASNRKKWSFSFWFKKTTNSQTDHYILDSSAWTTLTFNNNALGLYDAGAGAYLRYSAQLFRDPSAWYYILVVYDSDNVTAQNRLRFYCNGAEITTWQTNTTITSGYETRINGAYTHTIGTALGYPAGTINGYLADIHFIDGQALDPTSFGEFDTNGIWQPKAFTGSYGTNGFHLEFADNSSNTATTLGKDTGPGGNHWTPVNLSINSGGPTSVASASGALPIYNTTDTYGATKGTGTRTDANASSLVLAIPMDGANNGTTFTDESATIKGSGSAKTITRFGDAKTSTAQSKFYGSSLYLDGTGDYLQVPSSADFQFGSGDFTVEAWIYRTGGEAIAPLLNKRFAASPSGYLVSAGQFSAYINGAWRQSVITASVASNRWLHVALVRSGNVFTLYHDGISVGSYTQSGVMADDAVDVTVGVAGGTTEGVMQGYMQDLRVYKGVAKYTGNFNPPSSTQNATVAAGCDSLVDVPQVVPTNGVEPDTGVGGEVRGNYCTWNPLINGDSAANGNLDVTNDTARGTQNLLNFDAYWEITSTGGTTTAGVVSDTGATNTTTIANGKTYGFKLSTVGALEYKNITDSGSWTSITTGLTGTRFPYASTGSGVTASINAGQRAFVETSPSGFKALCTANLPLPVVTKPSSVFDVVTYTGTGSTLTPTSSLGFNPDLVWIKGRSGATDHAWYDSVRGVEKRLESNTTDAEVTSDGGVTAFNSAGFSVGTLAQVNTSSATYAGWCWDAGSSTVTNTQGSITSTVRANPSAGFSIVTYTGNGTGGATVGHGLGISPRLILVKTRSTSAPWLVQHASLGGTNYLLLNATDAAVTDVAAWNNTNPTSSLFTLGTGSGVNGNSTTYVAYCFAPVVGYSSFGSYTGNGSADGPFVFCNFRPRWILIKETSGIGNWLLWDTSRSPFNVMDDILLPNSSSAEITDPSIYLDVLSNGFKIRSTSDDYNGNAGTYIYAAFAENPFQYARAR